MSKLSRNIEILKNGDISNTNFNGSIEISEIEIVEKALGIVFPKSYKKFLSNFNGGMILENEAHYYTDMTDWEPDGPKFSSYYFFSLEEFREKYDDLKYESTMFSDDFTGVFPILPICNTPDQETIMVLSQLGLEKDSPVFITNDIQDMSKYYEICDCFDDFIDQLVDKEGFPVFKYDEHNPMMAVYIAENKLVDHATRKETNEEIIERTTASITLDPKDSWSYIERGNAYEDIGQRKQALTDYNKGIELNNKDAFYRFCRGDLVYEYGSARKALIDLDAAVKLNPDDKLYRNGRAKAFLKLGMLQKALNDCNIILKEDPVYELALVTRCRVYNRMGEYDKADADSELLDDIYKYP